MTHEDKGELKDKLEKVLRERIESPEDECRLKTAFRHAFDQFAIIHTIEGPQCLANDVISLLEKEELI